MNKLTKYAGLTVIVLVVVVAIGMTVSAFSGTGNPTTVIEHADIGVVNEAPEAVEQPFGAMASPDIISPYLSVNGDTVWHITGDFIDASTTIVSIDMSAYGLTSSSNTVASMVRLRIDGVATTSSIITCGASASPAGSVTYDLMTSGTVATSTGVGCVIENGLLTADNNNSMCADGGSIQKIGLGATYPYFICKVSAGAGKTSGVTTVGNTFDGSYMVRIGQMR